MIRKLFLFLICFGLLIGCASATDYYVSTTGNNSNSGTQESPFLTISYAIDYAHDGDTVYVNSGTYTEQVKFTKYIEPRLKLIGIGDTKPIVTSATGLATIEIGTHNQNTPNATGHIIQNLDVRSTYASTGNGKGILCMYNANTSDILIDNCNISTYQPAFYVSVGNHQNITIQNCNIRTRTCEGIRAEPTAWSTINAHNNNIWAADTWFYGTASSGIYMNEWSLVNVTENKIYISGYTGIKPGKSAGYYANNIIYGDGYAHNAFESNFRNATLRGNKVLDKNASQQSGGSTRSGNVFYSAGTELLYNLSCFDFYTNNTTWTVLAVGGHQQDYYIDNFTANNHNGYGFRVFGFSADTVGYAVTKYTSNNILFKNCTINPSYTSGSYCPVQIICPGTNTTDNPAPYSDQGTTGFTRDKIAFINFKMGGNYETGYHNWDITDAVTGAPNAHHHGDIKIINSMGVDDIYFEICHPMNCTTTTEAMYYADVKLQAETGTSIPNAPITFATTVTNPETLTTITPVNLNSSSGQKAYVDTLSVTTTGANGRTPLPSDIANTIAITDSIKNKNGSTNVNWSINADGVVLDNVDPDDRWYRDNQDTSKYTITAIKNSSENLHFTGFAPSPEYNTFESGDSVKFQIWTNEPLTSVTWKKDGQTLQSGGMTYEATISDVPITVDILGESASGSISKTWVIDPEQIIDPDPDPVVLAPIANFSANATSGIYPMWVSFSDTSENTPTAWYWDFDNDGVTDSRLENPVYKYKAKGNYTVKLVVSNANNTDFETKTAYITVTGATPTKSITHTIYGYFYNMFYRIFYNGAWLSWH